MDESFQPLTAEEEQWGRDSLDQARAFAESFDPKAGDDGPTTLEALDRAFEHYLSLDRNPAEASEVIFALGAALGARLVDELGFQWGTFSDDDGTELAVLARPGRGDVLIFPLDFVAKRFERREAPFLVASVAEIRHHLGQIAEEWGDPA